jgi:large conductance mechanosensitive channel
MGFFSDFRASLMKGDVLSLATAVIGGAFGKIINSLVEDVIMPIVGLLTGGVDFTQKFIALDGGHYDTLDAAKVGTAVITYGNLLQATINYYCIVCFDLKSG